MGVAVICTMASFAHLYFIFYLTVIKIYTLWRCQSMKPHRTLFGKNYAGAESIFELVGARPAHDKMAGGKSMGLGVRGHALQALPLTSWGAWTPQAWPAR